MKVAVSRWCWVVGLLRCAWGNCIQRVANRIVMVSRWFWVVGLRRCARGKCIQRGTNRIVMWLGVVGLRRCAREKCIQRVANRIVMVVSRWLGVVGLGAVLGRNAFRELQIALSWCQGGFGWWVCGAVLGESARTELLSWWCQGGFGWDCGTVLGGSAFRELQIALLPGFEGRFAALCEGEMHSESCKWHCQSCKSHWKVRDGRDFNRKVLRK